MAVHSAFVPHEVGDEHKSKHWLLTQDSSGEQLESLLHPRTHVMFSQISSVLQSPSLLQMDLQTPDGMSHFSLVRHPVSEEHTVLQNSLIQTLLIGHSRFSLQGCAGALTQATFADGLGTKPSPQEQVAL